MFFLPVLFLCLDMFLSLYFVCIIFFKYYSCVEFGSVGRSVVHSFIFIAFILQRDLYMLFLLYENTAKKMHCEMVNPKHFFLLDDPLYPTSVYSTLDSCTFIHFNSFLVCSLVAIYIRLSFSCAANVHIVYSVCTRCKSTVQMLMLSKFSVVFLFFVCFLHLQPIERNTIPINYCSP